MVNPTMTLSNSMAAETCTPLQEKPTTGFATYLPSKRDVSTGLSQPMLIIPLPESSSKSPSTSLPILLPVIHTPSSHLVAHSGLPVTPGFHALPKSSSRRPSRSPFVSPPFMATAKSYSLATHPPSPASDNTGARPLIPNSHVFKSHNSNSSHARDVPPSNAPYEPFSPSQIAPTYRTATSMSPWVPESYQTILSTATSTVSETQQSTYITPVWITGATGVQPTGSTLFSTTTTLADGAAASATNEVPNPLQGASSSSTDHAFFGNHPAVIFLFLAGGIAIACIVALALYYCRRSQRQTQRRRRKLEDISAPLPQSPFTMRDDIKPNGSSSDQIAPFQSFINVPLNRSGDSLPAAHSGVNTPLPLPVTQRERKSSSHRVPVRYSGLGAHQGNSRATDWKYTGPFSGYLPAQVAPPLPSLNVPPPLPARSPLRLLADKSSLNSPLENPKRLSRVSSPSLYPPSDSVSTSSAALASENVPSMGQGIKKAGNFAQFPSLNRAESDNAYSSWRVGHSVVGSPPSHMGPPQTSLLAEVCRTVPLRRYSVQPRQWPAYKVG